MQEETDPVTHAARTQLRGEWKEMIVMRPDEIIKLQQRRERFRETAVDPAISFAVFLSETGEVQPIMMHRPKRRIAEAEIMLLIVAFRKGHSEQSNIVMPPA